MNSPTALLIIRWLISVTFRQAMASRLFGVMATVSGLCILLCLSVRISGVPPLPADPGEAKFRLPKEEYDRLGPANTDGTDAARSEMTLLFGAVRVPYRHYSEDAVVFLQLLLAGFVADTAGVLLALVWTAGFLPAFLEPNNVTVLLTKPVPRWSLLVGKYLGILGFVTLQALFFVGGTWLALGLSTGVWTPSYWLCLPVLFLHFAIFFSVSACLAVWSRSTVVCMVGSLAFWALCWATNASWHATQAAVAAGGQGPSSWGQLFLETGYWLLPKPADLNWLLFESLRGSSYFGKMLDYGTLQSKGLFHLELSILTSVLFAVVALAFAVRRFVRTDY
jgi:ABC-type transport system involved in multi-copper enzyme maturation permease subunit